MAAEAREAAPRGLRLRRRARLLRPRRVRPLRRLRRPCRHRAPLRADLGSRRRVVVAGVLSAQRLPSRRPPSRRRRIPAHRRFLATRSPSRDDRSRATSRSPAAPIGRPTTSRARVPRRSRPKPTRDALGRRFRARRSPIPHSQVRRARRAMRRPRKCQARGTARPLPMRPTRRKSAHLRRSPAEAQSVRAFPPRRAGQRGIAKRGERLRRRRRRRPVSPQVLRFPARAER